VALEDRLRREREECIKAAARMFPGDRYEVKYVTAFNGECTVDFVRKGFDPMVDCDDICYALAEEEDYDACLEECRQSVELAVRASARFRPDGGLTELTLPGHCDPMMAGELGAEEEGLEEGERAYRAMVRELADEGCILRGGEWVHSHELVREFIGGAEPLEEYPVICYYHVSGSGKGCKVGRVLEILGKYV
jgi:hypothetical protein